MQNKKYLSSSIGLAFIIVGIIAFNVINSRLNIRIDATDDNIFTLSEGTEKIIGDLKDEVQVKFYFTRAQKELPVMIKTYATRVEEMLHEYSSLSGGLLTVEVYDPKPDTDEEEWARKYGLKGAKLPSGNELFHGAVFISGDKEMAIPYFDPRREEFLEYDVTEAIFQLTQEKKNKIGIVSWLAVIAPDLPPQYAQHQNADWVFAQQLKKMHEVVEVDKNSIEVPADINTMLVVHPKNPSENIQYALDQFVLRGGRLIVFVDPFSRIDLAQAQGAGMQQRMQQDAGSDLKKLFDNWDIVYKKDEMVGDLKHMMQINAGGQVVGYPFFIGLDGESVSKKNVVTSQLNNLLFAEAGAVELKSGSKFEMESLVFTDKESGTAQTMMAKFMGPAEFAKQLKVEEKVRSIAGVFTGAFKTAYPDGAPQASPDDKEAKKPTQDHIKEYKGEGKGTIMVIADVDFMADQNSVNKIQFGPQTILQPRNDNLSFVINAVDYLGGDENLISIRSRGKISRPFTKVQELQVSAQKKWKTEEEKLSSRLSELQKKLGELQSERTQGNRFAMSAEQQSEIAKFREEERKIRKRRREVRKNLREDIESLGKTLVAANMLVVPFGIGIFGLWVFMRRNRKRRK